MHLTGMKLLVSLLVLAASGTAAAQGMHKCKNAAGKITYSGQVCSEIGLISAGEVTGRANVAPADKVSPERQANRPRPEPEPQASAPAKNEKDQADPSKRCFTVKTAKGPATRCNDKPDSND